MTRETPGKEDNHWYMVTVQPTLIDEVAVVCLHGNQQGEWQQVHIQPAATTEEANEIASGIVAGKLREGYVTVSQGNGSRPD